MNTITTLICIGIISFLVIVCINTAKPKVFDVHIHGSKDSWNQIMSFTDAGVYKAAISTSWNLQNHIIQKPE